MPIDDTYDVEVLASCAEFSQYIEDRDTFRIGLPEDGRSERWHDFTKAKFQRIVDAVSKYTSEQGHTSPGIEPLPEWITYIGGFQGVITALYLEPHGGEKYFWLREVATGNRIKCFFSDNHYSRVIGAIEKRDSIVHVSGVVGSSPGHGGNMECVISSLDKAEELSEADLTAMFRFAKRS